MLLYLCILLLTAAWGIWGINTIPPWTPQSKQISNPFNASLRSGSDDIPENDPRIAPPTQVGAPEQVGG